MVEPHADFLDSPPAVEVVTGGTDPDRPVNFRFQLQWSSLFLAIEPAKANGSAVVPMKSKPRAAAVAAPAVAARESTQPELMPLPAQRAMEAPAPSERDRFTPSSHVNWEMVVPKMIRSTKPPKLSNSAAGAITPPALTGKTEASDSGTESAFSWSGSDLSQRGDKSARTKLIIGAAAGIALVIGIWVSAGGPSAKKRVGPTEVESSIAMGEGGWSREPAAARADSKQNRHLVLYSPSMKATTCRFEFDWKTSDPSVGWVFRVKDTSDYYGMRLKMVRTGASPTLSVEHFSVYQGEESARSEKMLVFSRNDPVLHVRMDVVGPTFTLYLQGNAVEYWNDARLTSGALGFLEEWNQPVNVNRVRMSFSTTPQGTFSDTFQGTKRSL